MKLVTLMASFVLLDFSSSSLACSYEYKTTNYVVIDCEKLENGKLGEFIQSQTKAKRAADGQDSCLKMPVQFFSVNNDRARELSEIDSQRVAGAFIYNYYTANNKVFWGIRETLDAIRNGRTLNIVVDGGMNFFVLQLQNKSGHGETVEKIVSSDELSGPSLINDFRILHCENMFAYLQREVKTPDFSITVTNSRASNPEYRFKLLTSGLGGFYSRRWLQSARNHK